MPSVEILRVHELPAAGLAELVAESTAAGHRFVQRLVEEWEDGSNRFDRLGEALFVANVAGKLVGVCGLNRDPYTADDRVGRVRHLYVLAAVRRRGIGRQLLEHVRTTAREHFQVLRLRTNTEAAARFYEDIGFDRCPDETDCTHRLQLSAAHA